MSKDIPTPPAISRGASGRQSTIPDTLTLSEAAAILRSEGYHVQPPKPPVKMVLDQDGWCFDGRIDWANGSTAATLETVGPSGETSWNVREPDCGHCIDSGTEDSLQAAVAAATAALSTMIEEKTDED